MRDSTNKYELLVEVNGRPVHEYFHENNIYIEGRYGSEYILSFKNNSGYRVSGIISVDGLSIVNGQPAGLESEGFVVNPYSSVQLKGWVKNSSTANKFTFGSRERSYSNRTSQGTENVGVIGLMVFEEKPYVSPYPIGRINPWPTKQPTWETNHHLRGGGINTLSTNSVVGMNATSKGLESFGMQDNMGTGYGDETQFKTQKVSFQKRDPNNPDALLALYYDDRKGLEKRGIVVDLGKTMPKAFPSYLGSSDYCKPPSR